GDEGHEFATENLALIDYRRAEYRGWQVDADLGAIRHWRAVFGCHIDAKFGGVFRFQREVELYGLARAYRNRGPLHSPVWRSRWHGHRVCHRACWHSHGNGAAIGERSTFGERDEFQAELSSFRNGTAVIRSHGDRELAGRLQRDRDRLRCPRFNGDIFGSERTACR